MRRTRKQQRNQLVTDFRNTFELSWLNVCNMTYKLSNMVSHIEAEIKGRHFPGDMFKCMFLNENVWFLIKISLKLVPKDPINNIPALIEIMAWRRPGDKPLSEPMIVSLPAYICVARPQLVKRHQRHNSQHGGLLSSCCRVSTNHKPICVCQVCPNVKVIVLFARAKILFFYFANSLFAAPLTQRLPQYCVISIYWFKSGQCTTWHCSLPPCDSFM